MAQPISGGRELDGHEGQIFPVEELQLLAVELAMSFQLVENSRVDNPGKEIVENYVLVMKTHELLDFFEGLIRIFRQHAIVKAMEYALQLRNDSVFVIARIADQRPRYLGVVARQVRGFGVGSGERSTQQEYVGAVIEIGLIVRATPVNVVEIKCRGAEVG